MPTDTSENSTAEQPAKEPISDFHTLEALGRHVHRIAALLRAAMNTDPDRQGREDEAWLMGFAHDEAQEAERCYQTWGRAPRKGVA